MSRCTSRLLQDVQAAAKLTEKVTTNYDSPSLSGGHVTLTVPDRIYDLLTCTAEDLVIGFAHRVRFTINGVDVGIFNGLMHEDGSGYSYIVMAQSGARFYVRVLIGTPANRQGAGFDTNRVTVLKQAG